MKTKNRCGSLVAVLIDATHAAHEFAYLNKVSKNYCSFLHTALLRPAAIGVQITMSSTYLYT